MGLRHGPNSYGRQQWGILHNGGNPDAVSYTHLPCALGIEELAEKLLTIDMPVLFLGDAAPLHQKYLKETLRVPVLFAPAHAARQRAGALAARAVLLMEEGRAVNAEEFAPEYLRPSQAERVRAEKEAAERDG